MAINKNQADQHTHPWRGTVTVSISSVEPPPKSFECVSALGAHVLCQCVQGQSKTVRIRHLLLYQPRVWSTSHCARHLQIHSDPPLETFPVHQPSLLSCSVIPYPISNFWLYLHNKSALFTMVVWNWRRNEPTDCARPVKVKKGWTSLKSFEIEGAFFFFP